MELHDERITRQLVRTDASVGLSEGDVKRAVLMLRGNKMTHVYFVRHAQPNYNNHDDYSRELTEKGLVDSKLVTEYLLDKNIDVVLSSPYLRAVDTVKDFADSCGLSIEIIEDFRERKVDSCWIEDFYGFSKKQWEDFDYRLTDGECLREVQERNIAALRMVLKQYKGKNIVVGSHGTALSTIVNYYDASFGFEQYEQIRGLMPWIVHFVFDGEECVGIESINVFDQTKSLKKAKVFGTIKQKGNAK